jgi:hypothetical protein
MKLNRAQSHAAAAVKRGITWLDRHKPGWRTKVDPSRLNMAYPCECVLGQLCGDFYEAAWRNDLSKSDTRYFGFSATPTVHYPTLTAAWRRALSSGSA